MPQRPWRPCLVAGCPEPARAGRCERHRRAHDRARGTTTGRGYGAAHARRRLLVLARDPLCVACLARGRTVAATVCDHIVPLRAGGDAVDAANQQGLCAPCHARKRAAESRGRQLRVVAGRGLVDVGPLSAPAP